MRQSHRHLIALAAVAAVVALAGCGSKLGSSASGPTTTVKYTPAKITPKAKAPAGGGIDISHITGSTVAGGVLNLPVSGFDLGSRGTEHSLEVRNTGNAALDWSITSSAAWLTVSPKSGTVGAGSSQIVTVSVDRTAAPHRFSGVLTVTTASGAQTVAVTGT